MSKHTPGPWEAVTGDDKRLLLRTGRRCFPHVLIPNTRGQKDQLIINEGGWPLEMHDANAHLIAAAPDLLAACEAALELLEEQLRLVLGIDWQHVPDTADDEDTINILRGAIAKAKGEA